MGISPVSVQREAGFGVEQDNPQIVLLECNGLGPMLGKLRGVGGIGEFHLNRVPARCHSQPDPRQRHDGVPARCRECIRPNLMRGLSVGEC